MLSYALKIVWFSLSLSGLLLCWAVLSAFAKAIGSYRLTTIYCVGCTILQGIFCLGLIWKMDPFIMPRSFCIAQTLLIGFASFLLTGVFGTFSMISSMAILKPETWSLSSITSSWHLTYTLTLVIFPLLASVAQIAAVFKLDAVQPADDLFCDATSPEWVRFLGYAGTPLVFSIPFFCLAILAVTRKSRSPRRMLEHSHNSTDAGLYGYSPNFTSLPPRRRKDISHWVGPRSSPTPIPTPRALPSPSPSSAYPYPTSPGRVPVDPELASPTARQFHLPFSPVPNDQGRDSPHSSIQDEDDSIISSAFPTFAPPSNSSSPPNPRESPGNELFFNYLNQSQSHSSHPDYEHDRIHYSPTTGWRYEDARDHKVDPHPIKWNLDHEMGDGKRHIGDNLDLEAEFNVRKSTYDAGDLEAVEIYSPAQDISNTQYITRNVHANSTTISPLRTSGFKKPERIRPISNSLAENTVLGSPLRYFIIFHLSFALTLLLACISTLIDVISQRSQPTPFGTQYVALLLTAWAPVLLIGTIPSTRKNLMFWKRDASNL